jgi:small subunit ribosomal protein S21
VRECKISPPQTRVLVSQTRLSLILEETLHSRVRAQAEGGDFSLAEVVLQDGETLESALRRFKRKVQQEDIVKEIKRHSFYLKPGEKRRTKEALARKRNRKKRPRDIE